MNEHTNSPSDHRLAMTLLRVIGVVSILAYGGVFTYVTWSFMSIERHPVMFAVTCLVLLTLLAAVVFWGLSGWLTGWQRGVFVGLTFTATVLLPASALWPGGVTHQQFGFTVVGLQPVPALDVTISHNGLPWFRYKDHLFDQKEVAPFDDANVIVLGTGWHEAVRIEEDLRNDVDARLIIQPTGEAIHTYHQLLEEGESVALLVHTTC